MLKFVLSTAFVATISVCFASNPIEGDWQVNDNGPTIRFEKQTNSTNFNIIWLDGSDLSILPGTVIGEAVPTTDSATYDCTAQTDPRGDNARKKGTVRFVIKIDGSNGDTFTFESYDRKTVFKLNALLPYWRLRHAISQVNTRPKQLDGARKCDAPPPYLEL